jgi:hypothetical protein
VEGANAVYNLSDFRNYVTKLMSKSSSQHLLRLEGKLKITEKENNLHIFKFSLCFPVLQCTSHQQISMADLG